MHHRFNMSADLPHEGIDYIECLENGYVKVVLWDESEFIYQDCKERCEDCEKCKNNRLMFEAMEKQERPDPEALLKHITKD